jgi:hypothetical protein
LAIEALEKRIPMNFIPSTAHQKIHKDGRAARKLPPAGFVALLVLLVVMAFSAFGQSDGPPPDPRYVVRTIAGSLLPGFGGDNGPADMASLSWPRGIDVDSLGNIYIADSDNCRIRKIDTEGIITTIAGNGSCGAADDDITSALLSPLDRPQDVAVNDMGDVFFTESRRIRKVNSLGVISTVGGVRPLDGEEFCLENDFVPALEACLRPRYLDLAPNGDIYFSDGFVPDRVRKIDIEGIVTTVAGQDGIGFAGDGLLATQALLNGPLGVVYHDGFLYIADSLNRRIRCVDRQGIITTVAGTGSIGGLPDGINALEANVSPEDLWWDDLNNRLLFANLSTGSILELDSMGLVNVVIGPADTEVLPDLLSESTPDRETRVRTPRGVAIDPMTGDLLYSEGNPAPQGGGDPTVSSAARIRRGILGGQACLLPNPGDFTGRVGVPFRHLIPYTSGMIEGVTATGLPPGVLANSDPDEQIIVLDGIPTLAGLYEVTLVLDCGARTMFNITILPPIAPPCLFLTDSPLPSGQIGIPYSTPILFSAATMQTMQVIAGQLPAGLTLTPPNPEMESSTWTIQGTPVEAGTFLFTLGLLPCEGVRQYSITIDPATLSITTTMLPPATVGCEYSAVLTSAGGLPPYSYSLASGMLPAGLTLQSNGNILGIPTEAGDRQVDFEVRDSLQTLAMKSLLLAVAGPLTWVTSSLPDGTVGAAYPNVDLQVTGGHLPRIFTALEMLPAGLTLSPEGRISGTPQAPFSGEVRLRVTSLGDCAADVVLPLVIRAAGPSELVLSSNVPATEFREEYEATVEANTPASLPLTGELTLTFASSVEEGQDNPEVAFATDPRSRTANFTIPEGQTRAQFLGGDSIRFNSGTVAGTITLNATVDNNGMSLTDSVEYIIAPTPPRILSMSLARSGNIVTVTATGYAPRRRITNGTLELVPRAGVNLSGASTVTLSQLSGVFQTYFQTEGSRNFGSQFVLTIPLTITGGTANDLAQVRLTLVGEAGENSNTQSAQ